MSVGWIYVQASTATASGLFKQGSPSRGASERPLERTPKGAVVEDDRMTVADELSAVFARLSGLLFSEESLQSALDLVSSLAHETLPGTAGAGVTLIREGKRGTAAYSDDVVKEADAIQYELDEGPCLSAWRDGQVYRVEDMTRETRWPRWAPRAATIGMRSSVSVPLLVRGQTPGAIKVYSREIATYDDHSERILAMFAAQAAIVLANVQAFIDARELSEQLKQALESRQIIGEAIGVLIERERVDQEAAFAMLRQASQNTNIKLRELAREVVQSAMSAAPPSGKHDERPSGP